jgi:prepilin-type N-terminal cleavage/methylation domain-containing protein
MMKKRCISDARSKRRGGFTLIELLVSLVAMTIIILMVAELMSNAAATTRTGNKHIDTDTQARIVLDRMAMDFAKMMKRTDVDYYVKAPTGYKNPKSHGKGLKLKVGEPGNDQIAFFSEVPGYYPSTGSQSPLSLVAYRINGGSTTSATYLRLERMGKGLLWNGLKIQNSSDPYPIVFSPGQIAGGTGPWAQGAPQWFAAVNNDNGTKSVDPDYETIGPGVFRLEYYYLLKDGSIKDIPKVPVSSWDNTKTVSANLNAFSDVESIAVVIAVIDPASRSLLYDPSNPTDPYNRLFNMVSDMADFKDANGIGIGAQRVGDVENNWNLAVQHAASTGTTYSSSGGNGSFFPPAASGIRIYNRYFDVRTPAGF